MTMYQIPKSATTTISNLTKRFFSIRIVAKAVNANIDERANNFALLGMPKPSRKFEIAGPILGSPRSHFSKRGFEIENNQAATIMKTVVGSPGTTIPTIPIATNIKPRRVKVAFFAFVNTFLLVDIHFFNFKIKVPRYQGPQE